MRINNIKDEQKNRLKDIMTSSMENVPFYKNMKVDLNESCDTIEDVFLKLPIIKKKDIKENYFCFLDERIEWDKIADAFVIENKSFNRDYVYQLGKTKIIVEYTSGTTGSPFASFKSENERIMLGKTLWKLRAAHGNAFVKNMFNFIHNSDGKQNFPFEKEYSVEHKVKEMKYLADAHYKWWHIYPGMLESYSKCVIENNISFKNLQGIECNGAYISRDEISKYADIFKCKIVNNYGTREVWNIAYSGKDGKLYPNKDVIVEIMDEEMNPIHEYNRYGSLVVTNLNLKTMPFIRYYIGDRVCFNEDGSISVMPQRGIISGTDINGNQLFRDVVIDLMEVHKLKKVQSISIKEIKPKEFVVNLVGCNENRDEISKRFRECLGYYSQYNTADWKFSFTYDNGVESKILFTSAVN